MDKKIKEKLKSYYLNTPEYYSTLHTKVQQTLSRKIVDLTPLVTEKQKILDVGCGCGDLCVLMSKLTNKKVYGVDISPHAVKLATQIAKKDKVTCEFKQSDVESRIPYPDEFFDMVICTQVLEHTPNPEVALTEIKRVLKKDGTLFISFPGMFKCFTIPWKHKALKIYDILHMSFDNNYYRLRFIDPKLDIVLNDHDMCYLSFTPEVVRVLEKIGYTVDKYHIKGEILATKRKNNGIYRKSAFRKLIEFKEFIFEDIFVQIRKEL